MDGYGERQSYLLLIEIYPLEEDDDADNKSPIHIQYKHTKTQTLIEEGKLIRFAEGRRNSQKWIELNGSSATQDILVAVKTFYTRFMTVE